MFRKSRPRQKKSDLGSVQSHLRGNKLRVLEDPKAWHNVFFSEITGCIDEQPYAVLYGKTGRPNAPVRILLSMLILKEGHSWTDEQLYNECRFNLQVMLALGLSSLDSEVPSPSTYYDFKARLVSHYKQRGEDLLGQTFSQLTQQQSRRYKVSGRDLRMDSKLFNSNIARCTRLQLVIGVLQKFYKTQGKNERLMSRLSAADRTLLRTLSAQAAQRHTYPLGSEQQARLLADLGLLSQRIHACMEDDDSHTDSGAKQLIVRLLSEQYQVQGSDPVLAPKSKHQIDPTSMQSAHDTQATFRRKESSYKTQFIRGYCANITETCAEPEAGQSPALHLITDVQTQVASISDDTFFCSAIEQSETITGQAAENVWTDGGYNSQPNADFADQHLTRPLNWYVNKLQGPPSQFDFAYNQDQQLMVTDLRSGLTQQAVRSPSGKWRIEDAAHTKNKYRYLDPVVIRNYFRRKQIAEQPPELRKRRANVESTIHQVFNTLKGNKTKYRGKVANHFFVLCRCIWTNYRRINAFFDLKSWLLGRLRYLVPDTRLQIWPQHPKPPHSALAYLTIFYSVLSRNFLSF